MLTLRSMPSTSEPTGPVMPAWNPGFCRRIAESKIDPARGSPAMKWIFACMNVISPC